MGSSFSTSSVFGDTATAIKPVSYRKQQYLKTKAESKDPARRVVKHEQQEQIAICDWLREVLPGVHFRCDTASGGFSSKWEKTTHNRQQSSDSEPDIMIFAARHGFNGLLIELKATGTDLRMKRDGRKIRVVRDKKGKIIERDYKIRKKGDWASLHIEKQARVLQDYRKNWGYFACFAVGEEQAKDIIARYFSLQFINNEHLEF